jgi:hypothetical protein
MAKMALKFIGNTDISNYQLIEVFATGSDEIFISIEDREGRDEAFIELDLSTAIRFDKELRKQIGLIKNQG